MRTSDQLKGHNLDNSTKHDEIVLWLYDALKDRGWFDLEVQNFIKHEILTIESVDIEFSYGGGFIDVACKAVANVKCSTEEEFIENAKKVKKWVEGKIKLPLLIFFEVKTDVKLGETIRQINYYKSKFRRTGWELEPVWFVVAPGNQYKSVLQEQGINYIEYKRF